MKRSSVYLLLAAVGLLMPPVMLAVFLNDGGELSEIFSAMFDNALSTAMFIDISLAAIALWFWAFHESRVRGIAHWWVVIPAALVGMCFALPLFLWMRERAIEAAATS